MTYDRKKAYNALPPLPPAQKVESIKVLKKAISANKALAELKGWTLMQSNPLLLLQTITLQEAKSSSAIENVVTTNDDLYQAFSSPERKDISPATKEVLHYQEALWYGFNAIQKRPLGIHILIELFRKVKKIDTGLRNVPGTVLRNTYGDVVYTPPDNKEDILRLLSNLETYIHTEDSTDPLIKLAVMHYQFECIHPFPDGNGRIGRILNVLYLVQEKLIDLPVLYLSGYIIEHKSDYYRALQGVTERGDWETWILYILDAVEVTARHTLETIQAIYRAEKEIEERLHEILPTAGQRELAELLFEQPYCKISFLVQRGIAQKQTAAKYLNALCDAGILDRIKPGREYYYINRPLWQILTR